MSKAKFAAAKELIDEKQYDQARAILKGIDHPTAREWEAKLHKVAPKSTSKFSPVVLTGGGAALLIVGILVGSLIMRGSQPSSNNGSSIADLPTQIILPTSTQTPIPPSSTSTRMPTATNTPTLTPTSIPTTARTSTLPASFRLPTRTPQPTRTVFPPQVARIGPMYDSLYDETYNVELALNKVELTTNGNYQKPSNGNVYLVAEVTVNNLGPGTLRTISAYSFQVKDGKGAIRDANSFLISDCNFDMVDLTSGGSIDGCIAFEVPEFGRLEIIYAPFQYDGLKEGRYISFTVRQ